MYKLSTQLKDWQIAQNMFGKNGKAECKMIKGLRKYGTLEPLDETWCIIRDVRIEDDCGLLISNENLELNKKQ